MTDAELLGRWYLILAMAGGVVLVAAGLLLAVLLTARQIERTAGRAHRAVRQIAENTRPIWDLDATNAAAWRLRETVRSIRRRAEEIAEALHTPAGPRA